ncbi:MAG: aminodeoxychorismate/anthranilate synthase component II [bacterium]
MNILLLDNHDSFTFNLAELFRSFNKVKFKILTPEKLVMEDIQGYDKILLSPGPGLPQEQPVMFEILTHFGREKPVLGICLGFQAIAIHFGCKLYNLREVVHGQPRELSILSPGHYLFRGVPDKTPVGLYHSWAVDRDSVTGTVIPLAESGDGILMALSDKKHDVCGVQFHPESIMTPMGHKILENWIRN